MVVLAVCLSYHGVNVLNSFLLAGSDVSLGIDSWPCIIIFALLDSLSSTRA